MFTPSSYLSSTTVDYLESFKASSDYLLAKPFNHVIIDNFFENTFAHLLSEEFPKYDSSSLDEYNNLIEDKKLTNQWNSFGPCVYRAITFLCNDSFVYFLKKLDPELTELYADIGLHGGGIHMHKTSGKLNVHLDYSIHPKLLIQRKLNILIYLTKNWEESWGGSLGLYESSSDRKPGNLIKDIQPLFNRAVIFDTTQNSWHGLPTPLKCPENITRNSLALYYLQKPDKTANSSRLKAKFAPAPWQEGDDEVLDLIDKRSSMRTSRDAYIK